MALADRRSTLDTRTKFEQWLDTLNDRNRATVVGWLRDSAISNARVAEWIREDDDEDEFVGYRANKDTIAEWRRRNGTR